MTEVMNVMSVIKTSTCKMMGVNYFMRKKTLNLFVPGLVLFCLFFGADQDETQNIESFQ